MSLHYHWYCEGSETDTTPGAKSYCCWQKISDDFTNCAWYTMETHHLANDICESSCPSRYIKLAMQQGSRHKSEAAYCCAGKSGMQAANAQEMYAEGGEWEVGAVYLEPDRSLSHVVS